ncbi:NAD-binding protein [Streptomyces kronopolitis]|uniref:NAD-binding protein n=1 Tax=Streptomyces kronopolitis TaxID=1612435 RepID=UPI003D98289E
MVIGATTLARRVCAALDASGHRVDHLAAPDDRELRRALAARPDGVAVLVGDDLSALRHALAIRHVCDRVRLVVTVFDRTVAQQLRLLLHSCVPVSPADLLAPDWTWLVTVFHRPAATAFLEASRVVAGVGPAAPHDGHPGYEVASGPAMLVTVGFTALLTAGIVDRLFGPRLVGVLGPRVLPRAGHVIVVGLGQVGLRLCQTLCQLGVPVVGVEREPAAPNLRLARSMGIPVVLAHGEDREVLARLGPGRACALAAVGSEELDNVAVAVAAHAVAPDVRVVLRAGEDETIAETRALLPLGLTRDVVRTSAAYVTAHLTSGPGEGAPRHVVADADRDYVDLPAHGLVGRPVPAGDDCGHVPAAGEAREAVRAG